MLGSLPLLGFQIGGLEPLDNISRKFAFKVSIIVVEGKSVLGDLRTFETGIKKKKLVCVISVC